MNRIFKVIYSKTKHCYVVVSELAKNRRKCHSVTVKGKTALAAAVLLAVTSFTFTGMPVAQADLYRNDFAGANDTYWYYDEDKKEWTTYQYALSSAFNNRSREKLPNYQGKGAKEPGAVTAGLYAQAGQQSVTIGNRNAGLSRGSVFIGEHSGYDEGQDYAPQGMKNNYVTAVGFESDATGWGSIAIGSNATAENSKTDSQVVEIEKNANTSGTVSDDVYEIEKNPAITGASVALGYSAKAKDGNIAIGAYSDATDTTTSTTPYVSVGNSTLQRRITNVADGTTDTDVATVGQMKAAIAKTDVSKKANIDATNVGKNLQYKADGTTAAEDSDKTANENAWGEAIGTGKIADSSATDATTNGSQQLVTGGTVYSEVRPASDGTYVKTAKTTAANLTALDTQVKANADTLNDSTHNIKYYSVNSTNAPTFGFDAYTNEKNNGASGRASLAAGFITHADGLASTVAGSYSGIYNKGTVSGIDFRGAAALSYGAVNINRNTDTTKTYSGAANSLIGQGNVTTDSNAAIILGAGNTVKDSYRDISNFNMSGNMEDVLKKAVPNSGGQVMVMGGGNSVEKAYKTQVTGVGNTVTGSGDAYDADKSSQLNYVEGFYTTLTNGKNDYLIGAHNTVTGDSTDKNQSNIVFGDNHTLTNTKNNIILGSADNGDTTTVSDVVSMGHNAKVTKEGGVAIGSESEATTAAGVAGYDPTGAAETGATWKATNGAVSIGKADGTVTRQINGVAAGTNETDAVNVAQLKKLDGKKADADAGNLTDSNVTAWQSKLGNGAVAKENTGLVTGGTVYNYNAPAAETGKTLNYVSADKTTGQNLTALDTQVKANTDTLNDSTHNIKYYSVNGADMPSFGLDASLSNAENKGAAGRGSLAAGAYTYSAGLASTVAGSYSGIINQNGNGGLDFRGAAALSYGTFNVNMNTDADKAFSGTANSIIGQGNVTTDSNAAIIYGAGNTVTNSYRAIDTSKIGAIYDSVGDSEKMAAALQDAVPESGGQVMVMGGGNAVNNAYMTQVTGVGNTVKGSGTEYGADSTQLNYIEGFYTKLENGKNDYLIGAHNTVTGDSTETNQSNIVFGDNHKLTNTKNNLILGSSDTADNETTVSDVVSIGHNAKVTKEGGVALGSGSEATTAAGVAGYDPTGASETGAKWNATKGAVSIGTADGTVTRQINGVAAGTNETDAVNVAQLKKLDGKKADADAGNLTDSNVTAWQSKLGNGAVAKENTGLVTGGTVYNYNAPAAETGKTLNYVSTDKTTGQNLTALDTHVGTNTTDISNLKDLSNITEKGQTVIKNLSKGSINMVDGSHTTVSKRDVNGVDTYKVDVSTDGEVKEGNGNIVSGGTVYKALQDAKTETNTGLALKANVDASNIGANLKDSDGKAASADDIKKNEDAWGSAIGTGKVEDNNGQLVTGDTVYDALHGGLTDITIGKDGQAGSIGLVGPKGQDGKDGFTTTIIRTETGAPGVDGQDGQDGITRIVYGEKDGDTHTVATLDDGLKFKGDDRTVITKKLNNQLDIIGGADSTKLTDGNIGVNSDNGKLKIQLAQDLKDISSIKGKAAEGGKTAAITFGTDGTTTISGGDVNVSGSKVTNLGDGSVSEGSTDAVTGNQLYNEQKAREDADQAINDKIGSLDQDGKYIKKDASISTNLSTLDTQVKKNADNIDTIKTSVSTLDKNAVKYDDDTKGTISLKGNGGTTITNVKDGAVNESSTDAVNGKQLYNEQKAREDADQAINDKIGSLTDNGNYIQKDDTISQNLSTLDTHVKQNADAISQETKDREAADKAINDKIGSLTDNGNYIQKDDTISQNLSTLDTHVKQNADNITNIQKSVSNLDKDAVKYDDDTKGKISLKGNGGTTITNVKDGSVAENSKDAVNGGQLFEVDQKVTNNTTEINKIKNGDFTDASKKAIHNIAKDAVEVTAGTNTEVIKTEGTDTTPTQYKVNVAGNGKVASGDTGLISGGTLYNEVHVEKDGSYIKGSNTVGQNLSSLDTGLKNTSDLIHTTNGGSIIHIGENSSASKVDVSGKDSGGSKTGRVVTGVVTDMNDANSAANVGYVNGVTAANTQQIYHDMNSAYSRLDSNINKAAAGANALAALHPLDYDPDDKLNFAAGFGHYHSANAAAVGAFYYPNERTLINVGFSMGNGDPGINAGISFRLGKGSVYNGVSKAAMAQTIHDQAVQISDIKAADLEKDKRIDALEKENQEMKQQIQEILKRLNG